MMKDFGILMPFHRFKISIPAFVVVLIVHHIRCLYTNFTKIKHTVYAQQYTFLGLYFAVTVI